MTAAIHLVALLAALNSTLTQDHLMSHALSGQDSVAIESDAGLRFRRDGDPPKCSIGTLSMIFFKVKQYVSPCQSEIGGAQANFSQINLDDHCGGDCYNLVVTATGQIDRYGCTLDLSVLEGMGAFIGGDAEDELNELHQIGLDRFTPKQMHDVHDYFVSGCKVDPGFNGTCLSYVNAINSTTNGQHAEACKAFANNSDPRCTCWVMNGTELWNEIFPVISMCQPGGKMVEGYEFMCEEHSFSEAMKNMSDSCGLETVPTPPDCAGVYGDIDHEAYHGSKDTGSDDDDADDDCTDDCGSSNKGSKSGHKTMIDVVISLAVIGGLVLVVLLARFVHNRSNANYRPMEMYDFGDNDEESRMATAEDDGDDEMMVLNKDPAPGAEMPQASLQIDFIEGDIVGDMDA